MCEKKKYSAIHIHTDHSALDGAASADKLVKRAKEFGCYAVAINDHGSPSNLYTFAKEAKKQGIKPILGLEFYINNDLRSRIVNKDRSLEDRDYHQSVYIKDKDGYLNFNYLTYTSFTDGYYYKPRIDFDVLFERKKGLMITSSCMASKIGNYIRNGQSKDAEQLFKRYVKEFGDDFYAEIQFNEVEGQKEINAFVINMAKKYGIETLIGGDVHYLNPEDNLLQDAIIKSKRDSEDDWAISARKLYFHDTKDYFDLNKEFGFNYDTKFLEQCFENSISFSEKVNFEFETGKYHLPKIETGGISSKEYIEQIAWDGVAKNIEKERKYFPDKYTDEEIDKLTKQIEYELKVIDDLGLNDYLLTVYDVINYCKQNNLYVGPGRGSAAGSSVCWGLGITALNPMEHGLIFERFINPQRKVMADIDADFEQGARDLILQYLISKYGQESVVNVPTFGTYGVKSALAAMSRGLGKETGHDTILMKKITKLEKLDEAENLPEYFKKMRNKTLDDDIIDWIDNNQDTIDFAQRILGQMTQLGVHAGGIVITPGPVYNFIPVTRGSGNLIAAFREADGSSKDLGELGILKLDILGLKTLNILKFCVENIKKDKGIDLYEQIDCLDLTDKKVLNYFGTKSPYGIFQMERAKMFTDKIHVDDFEDIVAINAINRPGPLEKYLNKYGYWKDIDKGKIKLDQDELDVINMERYPFEFMEKVLSPTYGCLLYQEQFMALVQVAGGFDMGEADSFRRVIAWKPDHPKFYTVEKYYKQLEEKMGEKGYTKDDVNKFVEYCRDFAGYSFNKCLGAGNKLHSKVRGEINLLDVEIGEEILGYNIHSKFDEYVKVKDKISNGKKKIYRVKTINGTLECTMEHKILCEDGKMRPLKEIIKDTYLKIKVKV
jgi:DNA polymerase-3 subunit alpha